MKLLTDINIKALQPFITYHDKLLLTGSCFTEHIGNYLADVKFSILQNPHGILFDPLSVCSSLISYIQNRRYTADDLFYLNEAWHSWQHHSRFSHPDKDVCLQMINESQAKAHTFLKQADWLIVTLGSSFSYKLADGLMPVANCHKAPAQTFKKHLCTIEETVTALDGTIHQLFHFNKQLKIIFTISPVRHLRDGVVENNRSKARLIEAVHHLADKFDRLYYFPAYELVIDVLRDYRFFDIDLAHPNYAATQFVLEKFAAHCFDETTRTLSEDIKKLVIAANHKPFNPQSQQHKSFLQNQLQKTMQLQQEHPYLNFSRELHFFGG
ncbi:GSCFA domain-containing protein [Panacibacter sp. DH6]|uniref:GSCFA domain-containing protein n=1 Tax=Panacibacter microcysteis TaxID=2793269 RepID=A0A931H021_9BACT|nr:GSCFA domain-containing protein [Panacibacter microcysteis]MBG9378508.1 GSCFA domain-containing protein [Panacibacter microcysteis]